MVVAPVVVVAVVLIVAMGMETNLVGRNFVLRKSRGGAPKGLGKDYLAVVVGVDIQVAVKSVVQARETGLHGLVLLLAFFHFDLSSLRLLFQQLHAASGLSYFRAETPEVFTPEDFQRPYRGLPKVF
jgi:hypothetical protein